MTNNNEDSGGFGSKFFRDELKPLVAGTGIKILEFCPNGLNGFSLRDEEGNKIYPSPRAKIEVATDDRFFNQPNKI